MNVRQKKLEMIEAMNRARALEPSSFVPNKLLDTLIEKLNLKNDAELCRVLEVQPPIISKIRHGKLAVGATILLRMHEKSETLDPRPERIVVDRDPLIFMPLPGLARAHGAAQSGHHDSQSAPHRATLATSRKHSPNHAVCFCHQVLPRPTPSFHQTGVTP